MKHFEEHIKKQLKDQAVPLPESYRLRMEFLLKELPEKKKKEKKISFRLRIAIAGIVIFFIAAPTVYAGVALYQKRLQLMSEGEKVEINKNIQESNAQADQYSRLLTERERDRIEKLRDQYEKGNFPKAVLETVKTTADVRENTFLYCYENSMFYLPKEELSDEQILQIIDFCYKRDFSIKEENKIEEAVPGKEEIGKSQAVQIAKQYLKKIYGISAGGKTKTHIEYNATTDAQDNPLCSYFVNFTQKSWPYTVCVDIGSQNGCLERLSLQYKDGEEIAADIQVNQEEYLKYAEQIEIMLGKIASDRKVKRLRFSYYYHGRTLNRGNVKYIAQLEDGTGIVLMYSARKKSVYEIYCIDFYKEFIRHEKKTEKQYKKQGVDKRIVKLKLHS